LVLKLLETWLALDDGDLFSQIRAKASGKVLKPKPLSPRPHQVKAIKELKITLKLKKEVRLLCLVGRVKV
jgi:hypothetical protein